MMEIGIGLPQAGPFACPDALRTVATAAERAGFSSLWALDRVLTPLSGSATGGGGDEAERRRSGDPGTAALDPLLALAAAAAVTETIRLGTGVLVAPLHPPVLLARSAASLDRLSDGRFTLGLGLGDVAEEYRATGNPRRRLGARLEEVLDVLVSVWRDDVVELRTGREEVVPSGIGLKPVRGGRVPVMLAASTATGLERVARRADGWIPRGSQLADLEPGWRYVLRLAERYGRDPSDLRLTVRADVRVTEAVRTDRRAFTGSVVQIRGDVERAAGAGAHEVVLDLQRSTSSGAELLDLAAAIRGDDVAGAA